MAIPVELKGYIMDVHIMNSVAKTNDGLEQAKKEREEFMRALCAGVNSEHREVIKLRNVDKDHQGITQKHLDDWRKGLEEEVLRTFKLPQCFDFCNKPADAEFLYCYITPSSRPATASYNLRLPTDTSTEVVEDYHQVVDVLLRREDSMVPRPFFDFGDHLPKSEELKSTREFFAKPQHSICRFPGVAHLKIGDIVKTPESKTVQYKKLRDGGSLPSNIERHVSDYFGAFANHEGGWIIIGIEDSNYEVLGQKIPSEEAKEEIRRCLDKCAKRKIWGRGRETPVRGKHWEVSFHHLTESSFLIEVRVNPFYGGVFQKEPESYTFEVKDGKTLVVQAQFEMWLEAMIRERLTEQRRSVEMRQKFEMLSTHVSGGCKVFALKNSHRDLQEHMFTIKEGLHVWPESYVSLVPHTVSNFLQQVISDLKEMFKDIKGVCVVSQCILADIGLQRPQSAKDVVCDVLVFTETTIPFLVTLGWEDSCQNYSEKAAIELEDCLTRYGGEGRFFIKSCWCDLAMDVEYIPGILESIQCHAPPEKPASYHQMHPQKLRSIISGLAIAVASFIPETYLYMRDLAGVQVMNLLTPSQLLALTRCKEVPHVCIQGYPGTGKTVVGIERAKQLRLGGAKAEEILYIPSNVQMATFVGGLVFPKSSPLHGEKICSSMAFRNIIFSLKDGNMPEKVKYIILDDTQNLLSRRDVPARNLREDIQNLTEDMVRLAVQKTKPIGILKLENFKVDWLKCLCIWLRMKPDSRMVVICDESQSLEKEHYYNTLREFIRESNGSTVTLNVVIRNSEEITDFFKEFVSTQCYGALPTTAHDFRGSRPVVRSAQLSPEQLRQSIEKYTKIGYSPNEISLIRHDLESDRASSDSIMTTPLQNECMKLYREIDQNLKERKIEDNGVPGPCVLHVVLFFCLLTQELLQRAPENGQASNFQISLRSSCFAKDTPTPPYFLQRLLTDAGRYATPVRNTVVSLFEEKWKYLCELYHEFVQREPTSVDDAEGDIMADCKVVLLECTGNKMTNLQKLYAISEFLLSPVTIPEHIFRIIDVQHAGLYRLILFHILPNVHAIHGTHEVPARGQCVCIESLESFAGRENQVVISVMPEERILNKYTLSSYIAALASRARTKLEILNVDGMLMLDMCQGKVKEVGKYYIKDT